MPALGDPVGDPPRCYLTTVNALKVADCQGQGHRAVPETDPSVQVLLLNFNSFSVLLGSSFPRLESLAFLSLGKQRTGSLLLGERAFQNVPNITFLDLGGNGNLTLHPGAFRGLSKLEVLLLDVNGFGDEVLENGYFRDLVSLKRLDLSGNRIRRLRPDPSFRGLGALSILQLRLNRIQAICGDDLGPLGGRRLALLDLSSNPLRDQPACGHPFRNLTLGTLDVSGNPWNVGEAERFFAKLNGTRIRHLKVRHSGAVGSGFGFRNLKDLSASTFSGLRHAGVVSLDLSHSFLNELVPSAFSGLPDLNLLLLRAHEISRIRPGAFVGLNKLRVLDLSHNLLGEIYREALESLKSSSLQRLILRSNHIGIVQRGALAGLGSLQTLDLRDNALSRVPSGDLPSLRHLLLGQNRIQDAWGVERLSRNVTHLDFSGNRLADLGQLWGQLGEIPNLRFLNLSGNTLARCYCVGKSPRQLRELDLSHNALGDIWGEEKCVDVFRDAQKLAVLNLSSNALRTLPRALFQTLVSLQVLDLSSNLLSELPDQAFHALRSLRILSVRGNPLLTISPAPFAALEGLHSLDLRDVSLICDCRLSDFQLWMDEKATGLSEGEATLSCVQPHPSFRRLSLPAFLKSHCLPPSPKASGLISPSREGEMKMI
nr:toll-like receptor 5 [Pogona vitticeps]